MNGLPLLRSALISISSAALFVVGCGSNDGRTSQSDAVDATRAPASDDARGPEITITGCLTANPDGRGYALSPADTATTPAERSLQMPGRETVTYELVADTAALRPHANSVVSVRGREDASARRETDVSRSAEVEQPSAAGVDDTPTVETTEEIGLNVRRFHVDTVVDSGSACPSIGRMSPEGASGSDGR